MKSTPTLCVWFVIAIYTVSQRTVSQRHPSCHLLCRRFFNRNVGQSSHEVQSSHPICRLAYASNSTPSSNESICHYKSMQGNGVVQVADPVSICPHKEETRTHVLRCMQLEPTILQDPRERQAGVMIPPHKQPSEDEIRNIIIPGQKTQMKVRDLAGEIRTTRVSEPNISHNRKDPKAARMSNHTTLGDNVVSRNSEQKAKNIEDVQNNVTITRDIQSSERGLHEDITTKQVFGQYSSDISENSKVEHVSRQAVDDVNMAPEDRTDISVTDVSVTEATTNKGTSTPITGEEEIDVVPSRILLPYYTPSTSVIYQLFPNNKSVTSYPYRPNLLIRDAVYMSTINRIFLSTAIPQGVFSLPLDTTDMTKLIKDNVMVMSVDEKRKLLFFITMYERPHRVGRMDARGSNLKYLFGSQYARSITVDPIRERIFVSEGIYVTSSSYDGTHKKLVFRLFFSSILALDADENVLYYHADKKLFKRYLLQNKTAPVTEFPHEADRIAYFGHRVYLSFGGIIGYCNMSRCTVFYRTERKHKHLFVIIP